MMRLRRLPRVMALLIAASAALAAGADDPPPQAQPTEPPAAAAERPSAPGIGSGQINGTVLNLQRKEVVGLTVAAIPRDGGVVHGTSTDETGRYAFKGLEAGHFDIVIGLPSGMMLKKDGIRVRPLFRSIVDFTLPDAPPPGLAPRVAVAAAGTAGDPLRLETVVATTDRAPAPDALVTVTPTAAATGAARSARTGIDGTCTLPEVPAGIYRIAVRSPGLITWNFGPIELGGGGPLRLAIHLAPFPMGFEGTLEDHLIPADPIQPSER